MSAQPSPTFQDVRDRIVAECLRREALCQHCFGPEEKAAEYAIKSLREWIKALSEGEP